jgi:hypothetical protein
MMMRAAAITMLAGLALPGLIPAFAAAADSKGPQPVVADAPKADAQKPLSPEEQMKRRFPQPVRVGDLVGLRVLDDNDSTIGFVRDVVRTPQDKIKLIVTYGGWFGWGARPVAVPIEVVGILGRQIASLDMPRSDYVTAKTWQDQDATVLPNDASIRIALARR